MYRPYCGEPSVAAIFFFPRYLMRNRHQEVQSHLSAGRCGRPPAGQPVRRSVYQQWEGWTGAGPVQAIGTPCPPICIGLLISLASTNSFEVRLEYLQPQVLVCRSCERGKQARWRKPSPPGQESRRRGGVLADSGHPMVGTDWHSGRVSSTDLPPDQSYPRPSRRGRGVY